MFLQPLCCGHRADRDGHTDAWVPGAIWLWGRGPSTPRARRTNPRFLPTPGHTEGGGGTQNPGPPNPSARSAWNTCAVPTWPRAPVPLSPCSASGPPTSLTSSWTPTAPRWPGSPELRLPPALRPGGKPGIPHWGGLRARQALLRRPPPRATSPGRAAQGHGHSSPSSFPHAGSPPHVLTALGRGIKKYCGVLEIGLAVESDTKGFRSGLLALWPCEGQEK